LFKIITVFCAARRLTNILMRPKHPNEFESPDRFDELTMDKQQCVTVGPV